MSTLRHRVLLMSWGLDQGGTERQLAQLAAGLDRERFEAHVGCFHDGGMRAAELRAAGVPVVEFPVRSFYRPHALRVMQQMGRYLREHKIDLVHTFDPPTNIFGVPTARFYRRRRVVSSQRAFRDLTAGIYNRMLRITDKIVDRIVVNGRAVMRHMIDDEKVPAQRLFFCPNALDTERFRRYEVHTRPASLAGASLVIGCVAALRPEKGFSTLLQAFAALSKRHDGVRLLFVGDGSDRQSLQNLAHELGIAERCVFEPPTADVPYWLNLIDVFVLPSLSEASSNSLMEAMASGCCPIASNVGGNPEFIEDGKTGLLFPARNAGALEAALERVVSDGGLRAQLAESATRFMRDGYSIRSSVSRMEDLYLELLERPSRYDET